MSPADKSLIIQAFRALLIVLVGTIAVSAMQYAMTPQTQPYYAMIASHRAAEMLQVTPEPPKQQTNASSNSRTGSK